MRYTVDVLLLVGYDGVGLHQRPLAVEHQLLEFVPVLFGRCKKALHEVLVSLRAAEHFLE